MEFDTNKIKTKIAISKIKEENDIVMKKKTKNIFRTIVTTVTGLMVSTGVVFAGLKVYEKIWREPEKVEVSYEITEEKKLENMSEEEAKEIAIDKLKQYEINSNIVESTSYAKSPTSDVIIYSFTTEDNHGILINGQTGEWMSIRKYDPEYIQTKENLKKYMTEEQAKELAHKYYTQFGFKDGEYEIVDIVSSNLEGRHSGPGYTMRVIYYKKYENVLNPYESIGVILNARNMEMSEFTIKNIPFDNNELVITEQEAIDIVLKEDKQAETYKVANVKAQLMIVKMNADAYDRLKDKDNYYRAIQSSEDKNYYKVEDRVRKAWVVVLTYEDNFGNDTAKRYTEGQYSYFVDCTTGEIIGVQMMDFTKNGFLDAFYK